MKDQAFDTCSGKSSLILNGSPVFLRFDRNLYRIVSCCFLLENCTITGLGFDLLFIL